MRVEREGRWGDTPLDEYPLDDIEPTRVEHTKEGLALVPTNAKSVKVNMSNWNEAIADVTRSVRNEAGYMIDRFGNVLGVNEGNNREIDWPREYTDNRMMICHTHPMFDLLPSQQDLAVLRDGMGVPSSMTVIIAGEGKRQSHLPMVTVSKVEKIVENQSEQYFRIQFEKAMDNGLETLNFFDGGKNAGREQTTEVGARRFARVNIEELAEQLAQYTQEDFQNYKISIDSMKI